MRTVFGDNGVLHQLQQRRKWNKVQLNPLSEGVSLSFQLGLLILCDKPSFG